jgi:hypothetical protein
MTTERIFKSLLYLAIVLLCLGALGLIATLPPASLQKNLVYKGF